MALCHWAGLAQSQDTVVVIRGFLLDPAGKPVPSSLRLTPEMKPRTLVVVKPGADGSFVTPPIAMTGREFELHTAEFRSRAVSLSSGKTPATIYLGTVRREREDLALTLDATNRGEQPTTWCCGDLTSTGGPRVEQNETFERFHSLLTTRQPGTHCLGQGCYRYEVTATLTGRLDAVPIEPCPSGKGTCCRGEGYGHFGFTCNRLVIQSVQDVSAPERLLVESDRR